MTFRGGWVFASRGAEVSVFKGRHVRETEQMTRVFLGVMEKNGELPLEVQ